MKIAYIEWLDHQGESGWKSYKDLGGEDESDFKMKTIGYLIKETDIAYFVTCTHSSGEYWFNAPLTILKCAVTAFYEVDLK